MYNYLEAMIEDITEYIHCEIDLEQFEDRDSLQEFLEEELWTVDSVTGNASGSYTFNTYQAELNLAGNWDLLGEALEAFGCSPDFLTKGAEACDVTIRCYLLSQAIGCVLDTFVWKE